MKIQNWPVRLATLQKSDQRTRTRAVLAEHRAVLAEHRAVLAAHRAVLAAHRAVLAEQSAAGAHLAREVCHAVEVDRVLAAVGPRQRGDLPHHLLGWG